MMLFTQNHDLVQAFFSHAEHPAFRIGIEPLVVSVLVGNINSDVLRTIENCEVPYRIRRKHQRLRSNAPIESAPESLLSHHSFCVCRGTSV
jgi:hypothetical protein